MINIHDPNLKKALRDYYDYLGDGKAKAIKIIKNKHSEVSMLLVRFKDSDGDEMSALMDFQEWADGHIDVTEVFTAEREDEAEMVKGFEESEEYGCEVIE